MRMFGGDWTETKLEVLEKYLVAYLRVMRGNAKAKACFKTTYLDGFAGCGRRYVRSLSSQAHDMFSLDTSPELDGQMGNTIREYEGSVLRALKNDQYGGFDRYIFIETDRESFAELERIKKENPKKRIDIVNCDANEYIPNWCSRLERLDRAVVFMDPFGLQVEWKTIEAIAQSQKIDLWLLVPIGGVLRMLPRSSRSLERFANTLTRFFGTEDWKGYFYIPTGQMCLLDDSEACTLQRAADVGRLIQYCLKRLEAIFPKDGILEKPLLLCNSKNTPIYMFCFAAANPHAAELANRIARSIVERAVRK